MRKVVAQLQLRRDTFMLRKLLVIVGGQGVHHVGKWFQLLDEGCAHACSMFTGDVVTYLWDFNRRRWPL